VTTRPRAVAVVALLLGVLVAASACGGDQPDDQLVGIQRPEPLDVSEVVLPDVTVPSRGGDQSAPNGSAQPAPSGGEQSAPSEPTPFRFVAEPGRLLVVYFGYTNCPDLCPTTMANLQVATEAMGDDGERVDLAMVTVDPDRDTPERLSAFVHSFDDRARAVRTTDPAALRTAQDAFGAQSSVTKAADGTVEVQHSAITYVVDDQGTVILEWPFGVDAAGMQGDLEALLREVDARASS